jgi:uncharacterized protein with PQ loop repeat
MYNKIINHGILASLIGLTSFISIVYHVIKTQNASNYLWTSIMLAILSNILWMLEGIKINSRPVIINSIMYIFLYLIIVGVKDHII